MYAFAAMICFASIWHYTEGFENRTDEHITMMNQALRLTRPGEPIMDLKGETIFRPRPFYYIFEFITRNQMLRGRLADTVPEAVVRSGCHVAEADGIFFPDRVRAFLNANFVDLGRLRASGQWLGQNGGFTIAVPGEYVILRKDGEASGALDGLPYRGARFLAAGAHRFVNDHAGERAAVLWAPAWQRGFSPFHLKDREF